MPGPVPIFRQMILCDRMRYSFQKGYTLLNPRLDFVLADDDSFPVMYPEVWLLVQLTGSFGTHRFRIQMQDVTDPTRMPTKVFETPPRILDLGAAHGPFRLQSRIWASKLVNVPFPHPGRYEIIIEVDELPLGRLELFVEGGR